jgi:hypothetical protein
MAVFSIRLAAIRYIPSIESNVAVGFSILFQRFIYAAAFKSSLPPIGTRLAEPAGVSEILFGDLFR